MYRSKNEDHGTQFHDFMANTWENNENSDRLYFPELQITVDSDHSFGKKKKIDPSSLEEKLWKNHAAY